MAEEHTPPSPGLVVGAAILLDDRDGAGPRVLACRRTRPAATAGRWEFPGGKVEPGEDPAAALVREIGEELGCLIEVRDWLASRTPVGNGLELEVATAVLTAGEARPRQGDHDAMRWLSADELDQVDWLEPDLPAVAEVRALLLPGTVPGREGGGPRLILFEREDADAAAERLGEEGWRAEVVRERYHGEDDDEDHPWAVISDAPAMVLELLADAFAGWLDLPEQQPDVSTAAPVALPSEPKRIKRAP